METNRVVSILALDPGESTGWCFRDHSGTMFAGTWPMDHVTVADNIRKLMPNIIVYENFKLYPGKAKSLAWNSFYPCEVIGVIKLVAEQLGCAVYDQAPSVKKYAGSFGEDWNRIKEARLDGKVTEHAKDAYQHMRYFLRYNKNNIK